MWNFIRRCSCSGHQVTSVALWLREEGGQLVSSCNFLPSCANKYRTFA